MPEQLLLWADRMIDYDIIGDRVREIQQAMRKHNYKGFVISGNHAPSVYRLSAQTISVRYDILNRGIDQIVGALLVLLATDGAFLPEEEPMLIVSRSREEGKVGKRKGRMPGKYFTQIKRKK